MDLLEEVLRAIVEDEQAPETFVPFNYSSNAAEVQHVVKTGASLLFGVTVTNANAAARFLQIFDTDKLVVNTAVPPISASVAATGDKQLLWVPPRRMDRGIVVAMSTTQNTLTLAAAEHIFDVQFV
jgi:hypothetical protein